MSESSNSEKLLTIREFATKIVKSSSKVSQMALEKRSEENVELEGSGLLDLSSEFSEYVGTVSIFYPEPCRESELSDKLVRQTILLQYSVEKLVKVSKGYVLGKKNEEKVKESRDMVAKEIGNVLTTATMVYK